MSGISCAVLILGMGFLTWDSALVCAVLNLVYRVKFLKEKDIFWMTWELIITA